MKNLKISKKRLNSLIRQTIQENISQHSLVEGSFFRDGSSFKTMSDDSLIDVLEPKWEDFDPTLLYLLKDVTEKGLMVFEDAMDRLKFRDRGLFSKIIDALTKFLSIPAASFIYSGKALFELFKLAYDKMISPVTLPEYALSQTIINFSKIIGKLIRDFTGLYGDNQGTSNANSIRFLSDFFDAVEREILSTRRLSNGFKKKSDFDNQVVKLSQSNNIDAISLKDLSRNGYIAFFVFMPRSYNAIATGILKGFRDVKVSEINSATRKIRKLKETIRSRSYQTTNAVYSKGCRFRIKKILDRFDLLEYGYTNTDVDYRQYAADLTKGLEEVLSALNEVK